MQQSAEFHQVDLHESVFVSAALRNNTLPSAFENGAFCITGHMHLWKALYFLGLLDIYFLVNMFSFVICALKHGAYTQSFITIFKWFTLLFICTS